MNLRDHSQPCVHDDDAYEWTGPAIRHSYWDCRQGGCPGGRVITIDYEAMGSVLDEEWHYSGWYGSQSGEQVAQKAFAAAIGDVEPAEEI